MSVTRLYWHVSSNFGDCLSPWLVRKLSGRDVVFTEPTGQPTLVGVGSLIGHPMPDGVVWGAGLARENHVLGPMSEVLSVRGPLTRAALLRHGIRCPENYGDPALLLRELCLDHVAPLFEIGLIPHLLDFASVSTLGRKGSLLIDLRWPIEECILRIRQCKRTVSSSLHGMVVSHAFGVPCSLVRFREHDTGGCFKFRDYLLGAGLPDCGEIPFAPVDSWHWIDRAPPIDPPKTINSAGLRSTFKEALTHL